MCLGIVLARAEKLIVLDPSDAVMFKQKYPAWGIRVDMEVVTATSFVAGLIDAGKLNIRRQSGRVTYHDPCRLARDLDETEAARHIIAAMGYELSEMLESRKLTRCCGGQVLAAHAPEIVEKMAASRAEEAARTGAEILVTACPGCFANLDGGEYIEVADIFRCLTGALDTHFLRKGALNRMGGYLLGADFGGSATKVTALREDGRVVASAVREYPTYYPQNGWVEQRPEELYAAFVDALHEVLSKGVKPDSISAMAISAASQTAVYLDGADVPVRPSIYWTDSRGAGYAEQLKAEDAERIYDICRNMPTSARTVTHLRWIRDHEPENFARIKKVMFVKDYIRYRLTGGPRHQ